MKNHFGPTPNRRFESIVGAMVAARELDIVETPYFSYLQRKYLPTVRPNLGILTADEIKHIDFELDRLGGKTAAELTDFSHKDMPWIAATMQAPINYQLAMYRSDVTSFRTQDDEL